MASIFPDHATCQANEPSLTAIELLEFVDDHCFSVLVDQVESEIDLTFTGAGPNTLLLDRFYARSGPSVVGSIEYLEIVEGDTSLFAGTSRSPSARSTSRFEFTVSEIDIAEMELDRGFSSAASTESLLNSILERSRSASASIDLLEQSETDVDSVASPSASSSSASAESPVALSGPSATDVPLISVYTTAESSDVLNRPQDEPRASFGRRVGFHGPSATDVPLDGVYTHNRP